MDRRDFLKVGGAAAVTAGGAGTAAQSAPAILPGATELRLASPDLPDVPGFGPDRLARRIELATGGRYRITATSDATAAELVFGSVNRHRDHHPAFAFFAGLPLGLGLDAARHQAWLAIGGGQMLWDDLAGRFGFKPLVAGHTGPSSGIWTARRLETAVGPARRPHARRGSGGRGRARLRRHAGAPCRRRSAPRAGRGPHRRGRAAGAAGCGRARPAATRRAPLQPRPQCRRRVCCRWTCAGRSGTAWARPIRPSSRPARPRPMPVSLAEVRAMR